MCGGVCGGVGDGLERPKSSWMSQSVCMKSSVGVGERRCSGLWADVWVWSGGWGGEMGGCVWSVGGCLSTFGVCTRGGVRMEEDDVSVGEGVVGGVWCVL